jgi:hypothetical protein
MGEEYDLRVKGQNSGQHFLSIHGRHRPIDQVDQSLLDAPANDEVPEEMFVLMDVEEQYSRATSRRADGGYPGSGRRSTNRSSYRVSERRSTQRNTTERATYKRVPKGSERRTTTSSTCHTSEPNTPKHKFDDTAEPPGLVAGVASMLNLKRGYRTVMDTECIVPNRRARSVSTQRRQQRRAASNLSDASTRVETEEDLSKALDNCDEIVMPKELIPFPPPESPARLRILRQQTEPVPESSRVKVAPQGKHCVQNADEDFPFADISNGGSWGIITQMPCDISEPPAGIRMLRQHTEPCGHVKVAMQVKSVVESVDEDSPFTDLQAYNRTFVPVAPSAPPPLDRPPSMRRASFSRQSTC